MAGSILSAGSARRLRWWHVPVGICLFGAIGWLGLSRADAILSAGTLTYGKKALVPRTVSPASDPFAFYYQVAYFACLGIFGTLMALLMPLAAGAVWSPHPGPWKRAGKWIAYGGLPFGLAWFVLHSARYWVIG